MKSCGSASLCFFYSGFPLGVGNDNGGGGDCYLTFFCLVGFPAHPERVGANKGRVGLENCGFCWVVAPTASGGARWGC